MRHRTGRTYTDYLRQLKALEFSQEYDSHAGGVRAVKFSREFPELKRFVWIEFSGPYGRGIHMMRLGRGDLNQYGRYESLARHGYPVQFAGIEGMLVEIIKQIVARDNEDAKAG